jgi:nucleotide-binding universal stress UspA family protein
MSYVTLMVHIDLDDRNGARLKITGDLAERFDARVIGVAAQSEITPMGFADDYSAAYALEQNLASIKQGLEEAEERFRRALTNRVKRLEWRSAIEPPAAYVAAQCRAADLIIVGHSAEQDSLELGQELDPGNLIVRAGRPVLLVPYEVEVLKAERILVGWTDSAEARRAVYDALPLLQQCQTAIVAEIDRDQDPAAAKRRVDDVVAWLACHGVKGVGVVEQLHGHMAVQLDALAAKEGADLLVTGAYGKSKLRELILGGATRDLLKQTARCHLLSH